jgi:hypothetical protein
MEVMFTIFTAFKLIENSFWESSETLRTTGNMKDALSMSTINANHTHQSKTTFTYISNLLSHRQHIVTGSSYHQEVSFWTPVPTKVYAYIYNFKINALADLQPLVVQTY